MNKTIKRIFSIRGLFLRINAVILLSAMSASSLTAYALPVNLTDNMVTLYNNSIASTFFDDEKPRFKLKIENPYISDTTVLISARVLDRNGKDVWSYSDKFGLSGGGFKDMGITIDKKLPYGWYRIYADISCGSSVVTKSAEFIVSVSNFEANEWASVNYHLGDLPAYPGYEDLDKNLFLTKKAGFSKNRDDIRWYYGEEKMGEPKLGKWQKDIFNKTLKYGQKSPIYVLHMYHPAYTGNLFPHAYDAEICKSHLYCKDNRYTFEQQVEAYADFCAAMARELKGTKPIFELGNEPDLDYSRYGTQPQRDVPYDGKDYAELVKAGYTAIKAVDPEATVISAGMCQLENFKIRQFTKQFLEVEGITKYIDGFAFHPYCYGFADYSDEIPKKDAAFFTQIDYAKSELESAMKRDGTEGIKIYLTEYGLASADDMKQAASNVRTMIMSRSEPMVEMMSIYNLVSKGTDLEETENRFGIVRKNYTSAKAGYAALSYMNKMLAGARFKDCLNERVYSGDRNFSGYGFERETGLTQKYTYVLWGHSGKNSSLTIDRSGAVDSKATLSENAGQPKISFASNAEVTVTDMFGNILADSAQYLLNGEPLYVTAEIRKSDAVKITKNGSKISLTGRASKPGADVTLLVKEESVLENKYAAVEQDKANGLSEYSFEFELPDAAKQYSVYVFDGTAAYLAQREADYFGIGLKYFANGKELDNLDTLSDTDKLTVQLTMKKADNASGNLYFYGSLRNNSGVIAAAKMKDVVWNDAEGTAEIEMGEVKAPGAGNMEFYLWNDKLKPITPSFEIKR